MLFSLLNSIKVSSRNIGEVYNIWTYFSLQAFSPSGACNLSPPINETDNFMKKFEDHRMDQSVSLGKSSHWGLIPQVPLDQVTSIIYTPE